MNGMAKDLMNTAAWAAAELVKACILLLKRLKLASRRLWRLLSSELEKEIEERVVAVCLKVN